MNLLLVKKGRGWRAIAQGLAAWLALAAAALWTPSLVW